MQSLGQSHVHALTSNQNSLASLLQHLHSQPTQSSPHSPSHAAEEWCIYWDYISQACTALMHKPMCNEANAVIRVWQVACITLHALLVLIQDMYMHIYMSVYITFTLTALY